MRLVQVRNAVHMELSQQSVHSGSSRVKGEQTESVTCDPRRSGFLDSLDPPDVSTARLVNSLERGMGSCA